ncbi:MAG TPA: hypothetical protein VFD32_20770 [Dehalococcoidia bacterium]|nr:hypothetical protein [Dehalococcoidia bacterium]
MEVFPAFATPPGGVFYHYTSRSAAQELSIAGRILPGRDGLVYLTDVLYRIGWQATDRLALPEKHAEVAVPVPEAGLDGLRYLGIVPAWPASPAERFGVVLGISGWSRTRFSYLLIPGPGSRLRCPDGNVRLSGTATASHR